MLIAPVQGKLGHAHRACARRVSSTVRDANSAIYDCIILYGQTIFFIQYAKVLIADC